MLDTARKSVARLLDRRMGIDTTDAVDEHELGYDPTTLRGYEASRWLMLGTVLPRRRTSEQDVFVDLGSGKGRVVVQAARQYRLKRVIGVELSPELNRVAEENVRANAKALKCPVDLIVADAVSWMPPDDLTIVFMSNPFRGEVFAGAMKQLADLVQRRGRPLHVIYANPLEHAAVMRAGHVRELSPPSDLRLRISGIPPGWVKRYQLDASG